MSQSGRIALRRMLVAAVATLTLVAPILVYAQQPMNAQPLTARGLALTAQELGPEWYSTSEDTRRVEGTEIYNVEYSAPSGRHIRLALAVASSVELAENVITFEQQLYSSYGILIISVQQNGFGDGRAFQGVVNDGHSLLTVYIFRVKNLHASVLYQGAASATDVPAQALDVARRQEAKLWAAFAPPPTPTPAPAATPVPTAIVAQPTPMPVPVVVADPYCQPNEKPQYRFGFASLNSSLGQRMGTPTSCEYGDPRGSGDTLQNTTMGLAFYRLRTNTPTFTNGGDHWALTGFGLVYWTGDSIDPPEDAAPFGA